MLFRKHIPGQRYRFDKKCCADPRDYAPPLVKQKQTNTILGIRRLAGLALLYSSPPALPH